MGEHPCGREWQLGDNHSANQIILHGYYFGGEKKPIQPELKPRFGDVSSAARLFRTVGA
jgi:hypothetical protein